MPKHIYKMMNEGEVPKWSLYVGYSNQHHYFYALPLVQLDGTKEPIGYTFTDAEIECWVEPDSCGLWTPRHSVKRYKGVQCECLCSDQKWRPGEITGVDATRFTFVTYGHHQIFIHLFHDTQFIR